MAHLSLHLIPRGPKPDSKWEEYSVHQRKLRLRSLKEDPASFISRYESEVEEPMSFWINRLKEPAAWTVMMVRGPEDLPADDDEVLLRKDVEWVAFCVMIDARETNKEMAEREQSSGDMFGNSWFMAAVWLSAELRGQGAGKRLVQYGIDVVRDQIAKDGGQGGIIKADVVQGNENALELYKKLGFAVTNADGAHEKEGRKYKTVEMQLVL